MRGWLWVHFREGEVMCAHARRACVHVQRHWTHACMPVTDFVRADAMRACCQHVFFLNSSSPPPPRLLVAGGPRPRHSSAPGSAHLCSLDDDLSSRVFHGAAVPVYAALWHRAALLFFEGPLQCARFFGEPSDLVRPCPFFFTTQLTLASPWYTDEQELGSGVHSVVCRLPTAASVRAIQRY
jgi:hypothetical protein